MDDEDQDEDEDEDDGGEDETNSTGKNYSVVTTKLEQSQGLLKTLTDQNTLKDYCDWMKSKFCSIKQIRQHVNFISRVLYYSQKNDKKQTRTMDLTALTVSNLRKFFDAPSSCKGKSSTQATEVSVNFSD